MGVIGGIAIALVIVLIPEIVGCWLGSYFSSIWMYFLFFIVVSIIYGFDIYWILKISDNFLEKMEEDAWCSCFRYVYIALSFFLTTEIIDIIMPGVELSFFTVCVYELVFGIGLNWLIVWVYDDSTSG